jgi:hypothetical protein
MQKILIGIGDIHGEAEKLKLILSSLDSTYKIMQKELKLREGVDIVFTGDYIDRGDDSLGVINLVKGLHSANPLQVHPLLGNHELFALSFLENAEDIYSGSESPIRRFQSTLYGQNGGSALLRQYKWNFYNFIKDFSREGEIGSWLRSLLPFFETSFEKNKICFAHAGIPEDLASRKLLNAYLWEFQEHMERYTGFRGSVLKYFSHPLVGDNSLFWDRTLHEVPEEGLEKLAEDLNVNYIVVGHTPSEDGRIRKRGRLLAIDTGAYLGRPLAALVFKDNEVFAHYSEKEEKLS